MRWRVACLGQFRGPRRRFVLAAAQTHGLLKVKTIGVDATDLEANASMKSIVRCDYGDDWREYVRKLYEEESGDSDSDDEQLRRFDKTASVQHIIVAISSAWMICLPFDRIDRN